MITKKGKEAKDPSIVNGKETVGPFTQWSNTQQYEGMNL